MKFRIIPILLSIVSMHKTIHTSEIAPKRLKCVTGAIATSLVKNKHGNKRFSVYERAQKELQKLDPKLDICYRRKKDEFIILNSEKMEFTNIVKIITKSRLEEERNCLLYTRNVKSGEKVLQFHEPVLRPDFPHIWLKGGFSF